MLDILGGIALTGLAIVSVATLTRVADAAWRGRIVTMGAAWFAVIAALAGAGLFSRTGPYAVFAIGVSVVVPIVVAQVALARSRSAQSFVSAIPLATLVALHAGRLLGGFFLALHQAGRLPATFAHSAGYGDILVGITAVPLAWAIHRRANGWQWLTLVWNAVGALDLVSALSLAVASSNSPLRVIFETPDSGAVGVLPWALIPGVFVPFFMLSHIAIFVRLAARAGREERLTIRRAA